jgi:glucokinase
VTAVNIGCDIGGTNSRIGVIAISNGAVLGKVTFQTRPERGPSAWVDNLTRELVSVLARLEETDDTPVVIGIATPGPLFLPSGVLHSPPNLPGWHGFELKKEIERKLGRRVTLGGDANVAALAEARLGAGKRYGAQSLCMLTLGTGVGSGVVHNGKITENGSGFAAEAGHVLVDPAGPMCGCGGRGCLEQYASATALRRIAEECGCDAATPLEMLAERARAGVVPAKRVFEALGAYLAIGLTSIMNTINCPLYVIGGGVSDAWELFEPSMHQALLDKCYVYRINCEIRSHPVVVRAELGSDAGLVGASML